MTVNAVRRRAKVPKLIEDEPPKPMAIGEVDANIVDCPVCKRPLDTSSRRCPGCRTRFVGGVQVSKVGVFVAFGLAAGLIAGGGIVAIAAPRGAATPAPLPTTAPLPTAAPSVALPSVAPTPDPVDPGVPAAATAALRGTTTVNARIASVAAPLAVELSASDFDAQEVARVMRRMAFEAGSAQALLPSMTAWPAASTVQADLTAFYADLRAIATETLASSIRNEQAYQDGARRMVERLASLTALDDASRTLAATVGLELPALDAAP